MSRLNARRNCEAQTGEVFYPTCKETATITYDAVIDSCNNGAIGGSAIGALALALGGKILSAAPVLSFTGGFGWITIGVGVLAAGYAMNRPRYPRHPSGSGSDAFRTRPVTDHHSCRVGALGCKTSQCN